MTNPIDPEIHVPTLDDLRAAVTPRRTEIPPSIPSATGPKTAPAPPAAPAASTPVSPAKPSPDIPPAAGPVSPSGLTPLAEAFLRHAAQPGHGAMGLEERWKALDVTSGSIKERTLDELRRQGLIRLERKGRSSHVHLYNQAYELLGLPIPSGEGVGGATHKFLAKKIAALLKSRGYEVYVEQEVGPRRKRVDVVAYGEKRIGVEIGLTDYRQEIRNLRADLDSGVLDLALFVSTSAAMLRKVKSMALKDAYLAGHLGRIQFLFIDEESLP